MTTLAVMLADRPRRRPPLGGGAASLGLHALALAALLFVVPARPERVAEPVPVTVEIVTPEQVPQDAPASPAAAPVASAPPVMSAPAASAVTTAPAAARGVHVATQFYASRILREPGMARIRRAFGSLATSEKLVQLCNIEGLEQIRRAVPRFAPDTLVPYAMADMQGSGLTLIAPGGAFRSRRRWYRISFQCTAAADLGGVSAFSFAIGAAIPESQWEAHDLNTEDSDE